MYAISGIRLSPNRGSSIIVSIRKKDHGDDKMTKDCNIHPLSFWGMSF